MKQTLKRSTVIALSFGLVFSFSSTVPALAKDTPPPPPSFDSLKHLENFQFKQIQAWAPGHPQLNWQGGLGASRPPAPKPPSKPGDWCKGYGVGIKCEAAPPKPPEPDTSAFGDIMSMIKGLGPLLGNLGSSPNPGQTADQLHALALALQSAPNIKRYIEILLQDFKELKIESKQNNQTSLDDAKFIKALELLVNIYRLQASIGDNASELSEPLKKLRDEISKYLQQRLEVKQKIEQEVKQTRDSTSQLSQLLQQLVHLKHVDTSLYYMQKEATEIQKELVTLLQQLRANYSSLQDPFWKALEQLRAQIDSLKQLKQVALDVSDTQNFNQIFSRKKRELHLPENLSFRQIAAEAQLVTAQELDKSRKAVSNDFTRKIGEHQHFSGFPAKVSALLTKVNQLQEKIDKSIEKKTEEVKKKLESSGGSARSRSAAAPSTTPPTTSPSSAPQVKPKTEEEKRKEKERDQMARRILNGERFDNLQDKDEIWKRVIELNEQDLKINETIDLLKKAMNGLQDNDSENKKLKDQYQRQIDRLRERRARKTKEVSLDVILDPGMRFFKQIVQVERADNLAESVEKLKQQLENLKKKTKSLMS